MNIVQVTRTFAVAVVLVLTATGLWAAGAEEEPAAAMEKETVFDPATGMRGPRHSMAGQSRGPLGSFLRLLTTGLILAGRNSSSLVLLRG